MSQQKALAAASAYNASESLLMTEPVKMDNSIMAILKKKAAIQKGPPARAEARCRSR